VRGLRLILLFWFVAATFLVFVAATFLVLLFHPLVRLLPHFFAVI
jgi:hypothetical protein